MKRTLSNLLGAADSAASKDEIAPTDDERATIRAFCKLELNLKNTEKTARANLAEDKKKLAEVRKSLMAALVEANVEILAIPKSVRLKAEEESKISVVPPYIRLVKTTKDLAITASIVEDAFRNLSEDDIRESDTQSGVEAITALVLEDVRRSIRSVSQSVRLVESVPRGIRAADIDFASAELCDSAIEYHLLSSVIDSAESAKRDVVQGEKTQLEARRPIVEKYFLRTELSYQRITLDEVQYNLCRRVKPIKPRITVKIVTQLLVTTIAQVFKGRKLTREQAAQAIADKRAELSKSVSHGIAAIPVTYKTSIHLQKVATKEEDDDAQSVESEVAEE